MGSPRYSTLIDSMTGSSGLDGSNFFAKQLNAAPDGAARGEAVINTVIIGRRR
jgi:hypothetical protein